MLLSHMLARADKHGKLQVYIIREFHAQSGHIGASPAVMV